jgi:C4-dicarboxylate-binding protein DctP
MQQGVVDGQENPPGLIYDSKFYEVQKYLTMDEHVLAFNLYYANDKWFKGLPEPIKKIFWVGCQLGADVEYAYRVYGNKVSIAKELEKKGCRSMWHRVAQEYLQGKVPKPVIVAQQ